MTDQEDVKPTDDIGPYYKFIGGALAIGVVVLLGFQVHRGHEINMIDVGILAIIAMLVIALIRPRFFDSTVKTVADKLPFTSFKKEE